MAITDQNRKIGNIDSRCIERRLQVQKGVGVKEKVASTFDPFRTHLTEKHAGMYT